MDQSEIMPYLMSHCPSRSDLGNYGARFSLWEHRATIIGRHCRTYEVNNDLIRADIITVCEELRLLLRGLAHYALTNVDVDQERKIQTLGCHDCNPHAASRIYPSQGIDHRSNRNIGILKNLDVDSNAPVSNF
jgi:hypothetical protein